MKNKLLVMFMVLVALHLPFIATSQNKNLFEKGEKKTFFTNQLFFDQKYEFTDKYKRKVVGVYYKKLDHVKTKTDTTGISNVVLKNPEIAYGVLNGEGTFLAPPIYTLGLDLSFYGHLLAKKNKNGTWECVYVKDEKTTVISKEIADLWVFNLDIFLYRTVSGKYGLYKREKEIFPVLYNTVEFLNRDFSKITDLYYYSIEACYNDSCKDLQNDRSFLSGNDCKFIKLINSQEEVMFSDVNYEKYKNPDVFTLYIKEYVTNYKRTPYYIIEHDLVNYKGESYKGSSLYSPYITQKDIEISGGALTMDDVTRQAQLKAIQEKQQEEEKRKREEEKKRIEQIESSAGSLTQNMKGGYRINSFEDIGFAFYPNFQLMTVKTIDLNRINIYISVRHRDYRMNTEYTFEAEMIFDLEKSGNEIYLLKPAEITQNHIDLHSGKYDPVTRKMKLEFNYVTAIGTGGNVKMEATKE